MLQLQELPERIEGYMQMHGIPGLAIGVVQGGALIYSRGFGTTSVEDGGLAVTPQTLFRIGSVTKVLTGTLVMRLVEQGLLELDRPIVEYLPWFRLKRPEWSGLVTLRMLLTHRSGLPSENSPFGRRDPGGLEAHVREEIPRLTPVAAPGTVFCYSNGGLNIAGHLAEAVTGKHYVELMQELVFGPLGMERTTFDPTVAMTYPLAQAHLLGTAPGGGTGLRVDHRMADNTGDYPCGLAFSTVEDLARFAVMQLTGGGAVLTPASVDAMHRPQFRVYDTVDGAAGLTFRTYSYKGRRRVFHDGAISGFRATLDLLPDEGIGLIILGNRFPPDSFAAISNELVDGMLDLAPGANTLPAVAPDLARWGRFAGTYMSQRGGLVEVCDFPAAERHGVRFSFEATRPDLYRSGTHTLGLVSDGVIMLNGTPYTRLQPDPGFTPDPARWDEYAGTYMRNTPVSIRVEGGRLLVDSAGFGEVTEAVPVGPDEFASKWGCFRFLRDDAGRVNGQLWWGERHYTRTQASCAATSRGNW